MKNDIAFVHMCSGGHLGDANCRKRAPRSVEFNFFINGGYSQNGAGRGLRGTFAHGSMLDVWLVA